MSRTPAATCDTAWIVIARTLLRSRSELGVVSEQPRCELLRMAQRRGVTALHLVGQDAEALAYDPALEVGREEPIVTTQQEARRHVGPRVERPRICERSARLRVDVIFRFGGDRCWDVVQEDDERILGHIRTARLRVSGVHPPLA